MTPADIFDAAYCAEVARYQMLCQPGCNWAVYSPYFDEELPEHLCRDQLSEADARRFIRDRGFEAGMRALAEIDWLDSYTVQQLLALIGDQS